MLDQAPLIYQMDRLQKKLKESQTFAWGLSDRIGRNYPKFIKVSVGLKYC
jgi:hypothetical protein